MGSVSEQRRGCRAGPRLWCRLGPKDQALSGSTQWAACRAQRAVTHRQQLGWGGLTVKGAVGACGCWLGLDLDAYTAAWTHPGSQKGAQERARFSACKLYPNRMTRKLPSPVPDTVGTRGGYRRDTLLGNQPHQSRACAVRPWVPALGPEPLLLVRLGGPLGRRWPGCQGSGNGPQWPASQCLVPPQSGREGSPGDRRRGSSGDMLSSCKSSTLEFQQTGRQTRGVQRSPGVGKGGQSWDGV